MCFSPEASFAGGVIISTIGIATIKKVHKPSQLVFASIPLFFGIQQIAEGFLWLTLAYSEYETIQKISAYTFLVMAQVLWPLIIPISLLLMEENKTRKKGLKILMTAGLSLSIYYIYCLLVFDVNPQIMDYHIKYKTNFPRSLRIPAFIVYLTVTITPLFLSTVKKTHLLGSLMFLSCIVSVLFFTQYLTSVWCFFAAIISGVIYWILRDTKKDFIKNSAQTDPFINRR